MEIPFPNLFAPIRINGLELNNRIVMTAMHLNFTPDGLVNDRIAAFYEERARGGAGLWGRPGHRRPGAH